MNVLTQASLSLAGLTGVGTAVGVPVALHVRGRAEFFEKQQGGGNFQVAVVSEALSSCKESDVNLGEAVSFGVGEKDNVCGLVENSSGDSHISLNDEGKYTHLFQQLGGEQPKIGAQYNEYGRSDCPDKGNQGIFTNQEDGKEFLGICESVESTQVSKPYDQGVSVDKKEKDLIVIKVCQGDCFVNKSSDEGKQLVSSPERGVGHTIKFQKRVNK